MIPEARVVAIILELDRPKRGADVEGIYCKDGEPARIPTSTKYKLLKRLEEMGYLTKVESANRKYKYYKLTEKGVEYRERLLKVLKRLRPEELCRLGVHPKLVV
ncbi:MAG: winged helix DNA-binding protein [Crenarchaeota archaeon]|nr:winged helix DNA-binding protein [Thermoproteota archaeon]